MLYLIIVALALVAAVQAAPLVRVDTSARDLERWHHARSLTSSWARGADER